jgi:hypothetical protein
MTTSRHLRGDYLEYVGSSTSLNTLSIYGLLQGQCNSLFIYLFVTYLTTVAVIHSIYSLQILFTSKKLVGEKCEQISCVTI